MTSYRIAAVAAVSSANAALSHLLYAPSVTGEPRKATPATGRDAEKQEDRKQEEQ